MFSVFTVNYDLASFGTPNYAGLTAELQRSPGWLHYLKSNYLIATRESAQELYNRIAPYLRRIDHVLVIEVTADYTGWLTPRCWQWISQHVHDYAGV
jgi:hypothetical protein